MLNLFPPQSLRRSSLSGHWRCRQAISSSDEEADYVYPQFDDSAWPLMPVPSTLAASAGNDVAWYRHRFSLPSGKDPARRYLLRFGGVFLETEVWLNGKNLGGHYGYFAPFAFDVTEHLQEGENVLAVRARCTPEEDNLKAKKHVLGIFGEWDCKPYPNHALSNPPPGHVWTVPLGLWRDVTLEETGPVVANWVRLTPEFPNADWGSAGDRLATDAVVRVAVELRNLVARPLRIGLRSEMAPANFTGDDAVQDEREIELGPGEARVLAFSLVVPRPALWWPWSHGEPRLYGFRLAADELGQPKGNAPSFALERAFGLREVRAVAARSETDQRWEWWLNGRRIFPKGSNYVAEFSLDLANDERYAKDLALARAANMDFLRVHAHIEKEEFYRLADEQGIMVMCDFPLIFCYAFGAPEEDQVFFQQAVLDQLPEMVNSLHHHPSIVLWAIHNEPPWPRDMYWFGPPHEAQANREVDKEGERLVAELDPSRPVIAASGEIDEHLYNGWYHGSLHECRSIAPVFPTEFGAQALPNRDSPFWQTVTTDWPIEPEEPSWRYADYQPVQWAQYGVGEPSAYASLEDYITASQEYQAFYCRYAIEHWRARKFRPTGGLVHFLLTDCWPAITWSVLDYYRLPKPAYEAVARAYNPTHVCIVFDGEYAMRGRCRIAYSEGTPVRLRLHLVNDDYRITGPATLIWRVDPVGNQPSLRSRLLLRLRGCPRGRQELILPGAEEGARLVVAEDRLLPRGSYVLSTELWQQGRLLDRNEMHFCVDNAVERPRRIRQVPTFLIRRLYNRRGLRNASDGIVLSLRNSIQDASMIKVLHVRVDGAEVPLADVVVDAGGGPVAALAIGKPSPLLIPRGNTVTLCLVGRWLDPGPHQIDLAVRIAGVGDGAVTIKDVI